MPTAAEQWPHLYNTTRWRKGRKQFLAEHPLCRMCQAVHRTSPAVELDHIEPHRGDPILFWDVKNWQGLCRWHHRTIKSRLERGNTRRGCDADGTPLDPDHPWNQ